VAVTNRAQAFLDKIVADPGAGIVELATKAWARGFQQGATTDDARELPAEVCVDLVVAAVRAYLTEDDDTPGDLDPTRWDWP
jgi:hypothetical protein